jgi:predicted aspartyl protease
LFLVDTGAGGTEMMFHSRAAKELHLLTPDTELRLKMVGISVLLVVVVVVVVLVVVTVLPGSCTSACG